jgi:hypothetical protein
MHGTELWLGIYHASTASGDRREFYNKLNTNSMLISGNEAMGNDKKAQGSLTTIELHINRIHSHLAHGAIPQLSSLETPRQLNQLGSGNWAAAGWRKSFLRASKSEFMWRHCRLHIG